MPEVALAASWAGAAFDLGIVPLLLVRRTRPVGLTLVIGFHLVTAALFPIGVFPWLMLAASTLFLPPAWPRQALEALAVRLGPRRVGPRRDAGPAPAREWRPPGWLPAALVLHSALQVAVPLRQHWLRANSAWTLEGFNFAWNVMVAEKAGAVSFRARDRRSGERLRVEPRVFLARFQEAAMAQDPDLVRQAALLVAARFRAQGRDVARLRRRRRVAQRPRRSPARRSGGRPHGTFAKVLDPAARVSIRASVAVARLERDRDAERAREVDFEGELERLRGGGRGGERGAIRRHHALERQLERANGAERFDVSLGNACLDGRRDAARELGETAARAAAIQGLVAGELRESNLVRGAARPAFDLARLEQVALLEPQHLLEAMRGQVFDRADHLIDEDAQAELPALREARRVRNAVAQHLARIRSVFRDARREALAELSPAARGVARKKRRDGASSRSRGKSRYSSAYTPRASTPQVGDERVVERARGVQGRFDRLGAGRPEQRAYERVRLDHRAVTKALRLLPREQRRNERGARAPQAVDGRRARERRHGPRSALPISPPRP